ncbi:MAG: ABC transporter ATP-binding protein [Betaproteobacteria bacterium]|nr:MAG: ABC transporter ATP-binding protein [Betaproteobacteria bacterium]
MIEISALSKRFGDSLIFGDFNMHVEEGEFCVIFGPSGCGKTTLLRTVAGLEQPTSGSVRVAGVESGADTEAYARRISVVWQDHRLLAWRTARSNVGLALELRDPDMPAAERNKRATEALTLVGLEDAQDRLPRQLSGGMRQRVNLARALALDAPVMLMDEPLASLNEVTDKAVMVEKILDVWRQRKKTVLYVTHSVNEALLMADRINVLSGKPARIALARQLAAPRPRDLEAPECVSLRREIAGTLGALL